MPSPDHRHNSAGPVVDNPPFYPPSLSTTSIQASRALCPPVTAELEGSPCWLYSQKQPTRDDRPGHRLVQDGKPCMFQKENHLNGFFCSGTGCQIPRSWKSTQYFLPRCRLSRNPQTKQEARARLGCCTSECQATFDPSISAPRSHGKLRSMLTGTGVGSNFRFRCPNHLRWSLECEWQPGRVLILGSA